MISLRGSRVRVPLVVALGLAIAACDDDDSITGPADQTARAPFSFAIDASNTSALLVNAINGTVTITGVAADDSVRVDGVREVMSTSMEDAEARLDLIEVNSRVSADTVVIETTHPSPPSGRNYLVEYTITVPRGMEVLVVSGNGLITIGSIDNSVSTVNGNGTITLNEIEGDAFIALGNGEAFATVTLPPNGTLDFSVGNGILELAMPTATSAEFLATVGTGSISVSGLTLQNQQTSGTLVTGTLGAGAGEITLAVGNGTITVTGF